MIPLAGAVALLCLSCADRDPLRPVPADTLLSLSAAGPAFEQGCARFQVQVSGWDRIEVRALAGEGCGPVQPVLSGAPAFDRTRQTVRLPIALENRGQRKVRAPAWLLGWEDSLTIVSAPGLAQNRHTGRYLDLVAPDSLAEAEDTLLMGARIWKYDGRLAAAGHPQTLAAGQRSEVRWVEISSHPGVESFQLVLHTRARRASNPVPPLPPETIPQWVSDSLRFSENLIAPGVVELGFRWSTPLVQKQEAVDLVWGEVIGGERFDEGADFEGVYYVQIDTTGGSKAAVDRAVQLLKQLPYVEHANAVITATVQPAYSKPYGDRRRRFLHQWRGDVRSGRERLLSAVGNGISIRLSSSPAVTASVSGRSPPGREE